MNYVFAPAGPVISVLALVVLIVSALAVVAAVLLLAALPGRIAASRQHPSTEAINICGWAGLPTGVIWIVALVWAYTQPGSTGPSQRFETATAAALERQIARIEKAVRQLEQRRKGE